MEKRYILFDLDGTLTDSYEGIINAFIYALDKMGIEPKEDTFRKCIGPPVTESLRTFYGMSEDEADRGVKLFREYYTDKGIFENVPYPDIETMLKTLLAHGKKLMVATAKPEFMAERVLEHFGLSEYFCFVAGVTTDKAAPPNDPKLRSTKEDVINYILRTNDIFDPENAVMVGDRGSDIRAAKKFGLQTIGAEYGYGSVEELTEAGADSIAHDPMQLIEIIVQS
ncbi:MAG: HAD hydrolase-like protein [Lachnospiraceae bacterium]|nr:HAD hydrolase-like protein [Lachnospiraceae bacterium]